MSHGSDDVKVFGFWVYLMTDLVIFAVLFATYVVLRNSTFGGPSGKELFDMPFALSETILLLASSFTCSLATLSVYREKKNGVIFWFGITLLLGLAFLFLEAAEFSKFIGEGAGPDRSGFLSSFFSLVGVHGLHISFGLIWMIVSICTIWNRGLSAPVTSQIFRLAMYWHFLDVVWVFIFTVVYGMGRFYA